MDWVGSMIIALVTVTPHRHNRDMGECVWCGTSLPERSGPGRPRMYCSASHRMRAYEARRRLTLLDVLNRYGDTCHLCRTSVDLDAVPPHPLAATIDQVLPLSKGGGDDLLNVRPAHFACNRKKGPTFGSAMRGSSALPFHQLTNRMR